MKRIAVILLCAVSSVPVVAGISGALIGGTNVQAWHALFDTPGLAHALFLSVWTGVAATTIAIALAHAMLALAATRSWIVRLRALTVPLLATPHLALAIGLVLVLSPSGLLMRMLSPWATGFDQPPDWATVQDPLGLALIAGLVIKETPFLVLVLSGALAQVNARRLMLQASTLGYGQMKSWFIAVAPALQRQARFGMLAVMIFAVTNVEMALPLAPTTPPPFSVLLLQWFTDADFAMRGQAFAGAWLLLGATLVLVGVAFGVTHAMHWIWRTVATSGARAIDDAPLARTIGSAFAVVLGLGALALAALFLRATGGAWRFPQVLPQTLSLRMWRAVAPDLGASASTTILLGFLTALISVALVLCAAEALHDRPVARRRIGVLLFVPLMLPQMAFLFGWQVVLVHMRLDGTLLAVLWSHATFALPYVWAALAEPRAELNPGYLTSARLLGAGRVRAWLTVIAPLLLRSGLLAFALAFSVSVAVYLPTLFAGAGRVATLATEAAASIASGNVRSASASAAVQALAPLLAFAGALWLSHAVYRNRRGVPR
ncbi:MAG: ABC transporter permease [Gammaproteobacteria bacterium]